VNKDLKSGSIVTIYRVGPGLWVDRFSGILNVLAPRVITIRRVYEVRTSRVCMV
jgi:hypothetical protein